MSTADAQQQGTAPGSQPETGTARVKRGMAEMLKGGVIMDVVTPDQAKIAEDAGAVAVMALERVPADIRAVGVQHISLALPLVHVARRAIPMLRPASDGAQRAPLAPDREIDLLAQQRGDGLAERVVAPEWRHAVVPEVQICAEAI